MKTRCKKILLIISLTIILFLISNCEKTENNNNHLINNCVICETKVINVHYKNSIIAIETKNQIDTLYNKTFEQLRDLNRMCYINDTRDSVINIWSTNCY